MLADHSAFLLCLETFHLLVSNKTDVRGIRTVGIVSFHFISSRQIYQLGGQYGGTVRGLEWYLKHVQTSLKSVEYTGVGRCVLALPSIISFTCGTYSLKSWGYYIWLACQHGAETSHHPPPSIISHGEATEIEQPFLLDCFFHMRDGG